MRSNESGDPSASLRLGVTTSIRDSGLLEHLLPAFESKANCRIQVIAVGSGAALRLARSGDVDAIWVHSYDDELRFLAEGHGVRREDVMRNYFLLLGPVDDPAGTRGLDVADALKRVESGQHRYLSRGDDSGTHKKEQWLFSKCGIEPGWEGYLESGQGMGASLVMADQQRAYILCDQGTYANFRSKIELRPLVDKQPILENRYGAVVVSPQRHTGIQVELAHEFVDFLISAETQAAIQKFEVAGQTMFYPRPVE